MPLSEEELTEIWKKIKLPERATKGSAGYDFFTPFPITLNCGQTEQIPTGIKVCMADGWVLQLYPRSGHGFKFRAQLDNTVGIIDQDYYENETNEGHIGCKITNDGHQGKLLKINPGEAYMQGIFVQYGITVDDNAEGIRTGGFGSTSVK